MRTRSGFTLIETVFAIFVFSVGALGFAATAALTLRSLGLAAARERAARIGSARLEILRSLSCAAQSGSETRSGFHSDWTVSPSQHAVTISDRVTYAAAGAPISDTYTAVVPCAQ